MNIINLINKLSKDANIFFYTFEQEDGTIIAKSHFFDFYFGNDHVKIVDSYVLPGKLLQPFLSDNLPKQFNYTLDNFYEVMLECVSDMQETCIFLERQEEIDNMR